MESKPGLWLEQGDALFLRGVQCKHCGCVQFPPQPYGCEACGADAQNLEEYLLPARGTLRVYTAVHHDQKLETPFQVAEVNTEASQPVRGRLEFPDATPGALVEGVLREIEGRERFVFVQSTEGE